MALSKEQKQNILKDLKEKIEKKESMSFADFSGMKVKEMSDMRKEMKKQDCGFKVAKKTLLKIALDKQDINLPENLNGEVGIGFDFNDKFSCFKILDKFSKETGNIKIIGGLIKNSSSDKFDFIGEEKANFLAEIPSEKELMSKMIGSLNSPLSSFLNVLQGNIKGLILTLNALSESKS
jgi:large subunit ribosomal protein L10